MNFLFFCTTLFIWISHAAEIKELNGSWKLKNSTMATGIPAKVPGGVHTALMDNGIIADPFYRTNDKLYLWVGRTDWTYYRTFDVSEALLQKQEILLVCEGLDTVSTVYINDKEVGKSVNMFVRYIFDVKHALKVGENTIRVDFTSAVKYAKQQSESLPYQIPPDCPPAVFQGECHGNKVRKMQCAFSWDWGPAFVTQGIWKDIYIQAFDSAVVRYVTAETTKDPNGLWLLKFEVFLVWSPGAYTGTLLYRLGDTGIAGTKKIAMSGIRREETYAIYLTIPQDVAIDTWWPNGYGKQTLYPLEVKFQSSNTQETSTKVIRVGFRTVELVQDLVSDKESHGRTFYFRINGQPIFLKGSNWIPADSFLERVTRERLYSYLKSAADAHMNTLRIWGGGIYEFDEFYEIADELGILIWQDFMFACALYPATGAFLQTVSDEITHQVRRLKHHPSLLAYSGNNENEVGIKGWWPHAHRDQRYNTDYRKLYIDVIYGILKEEDPGRPYMSSSPSNGVQTEKEGWISRDNPSSSKYGDIHDYNYQRAFYKDEVYRTPRMSSEYGLQSYPSLETLSPVYEKEDLFYEASLNNHRQRHGNGNGELRNQINMYLNPPNSTDKYQRFLDIIYCTQIDQAIGMRTETEHYRRWQSKINARGEGNTMGALYWMLNDIWQGPTWSSLGANVCKYQPYTKYGGKWKMLHYYARHFFAPFLISPYITDNSLYVYIVVDEIPSYEYRNKEKNTLELRPVKAKRPKRSASMAEIVPDPAYSSSRCKYGKKCYIWYILTVCCLCLIANQFYQTLSMRRHWRKMWQYTLVCLMLIMGMATLHMLSLPERQRSAATIRHQMTKEQHSFDLTGTLSIQIHSWDSLQAKFSLQIPFEVQLVSELIYTETVPKLLEKAKCPGPAECFLTFHHVNNNQNETSAWYPMTNFKEARGLKKPNLQITSVSESTNSREYAIVLTTDFPAPFVWLEANGIKGRFCDNGFLMYKQTETIKFYAWEVTSLNMLKKSLSVKSLIDIYQTK